MTTLKSCASITKEARYIPTTADRYLLILYLFYFFRQKKYVIV